jgi:Cof subfamily protein (haloacid dehalogenase superfamily)
VSRIIRLVALDIDYTLTASDGRISGENITAVQRARSGGRHIVLASSRPTFGVDAVADLLGGDVYRMSYSGGVIQTPAGQELRRMLIDINVASDIVRYANERRINLVVYINDKEFHTQQPSFEAAIAPPSADSVEDFLGRGIAPALIMVAGHKQASTVYDYYLEHHREALYVSRTHKSENEYSSIVLVNPEAQKGPALRYLCSLLDVDPNEVLAIGDSESDLGMFEVAGVTVAVGNAISSVRATASLIAPSSDENGVAWALNRLLP